MSKAVDGGDEDEDGDVDGDCAVWLCRMRHARWSALKAFLILRALRAARAAPAGGAEAAPGGESIADACFYREKVAELYERHSPEKMRGHLDRLLTKCVGREEALYRAVCTRYNESPDVEEPDVDWWRAKGDAPVCRAIRRAVRGLGFGDSRELGESATEPSVFASRLEDPDETASGDGASEEKFGPERFEMFDSESRHDDEMEAPEDESKECGDDGPWGRALGVWGHGHLLLWEEKTFLYCPSPRALQPRPATWDGELVGLLEACDSADSALSLRQEPDAMQEPDARQELRDFEYRVVSVEVVEAPQVSTGTGAVTLAGDTSVPGCMAFATGTGAATLNGATTISSSETFTTGTGAVTLNGATTVSGSNTFATGTGAVTLNGATTISSSNAFTTGTGAVSLNGDVSVAAGKDFDMSGGSGTFAFHGV